MIVVIAAMTMRITMTVNGVEGAGKGFSCLGDRHARELGVLVVVAGCLMLLGSGFATRATTTPPPARR
jgi:hypothetical protein